MDRLADEIVELSASRLPGRPEAAGSAQIALDALVWRKEIFRVPSEEDVTITELADYGELEPSTEVNVSAAAAGVPQAAEPVAREPELSVVMPCLNEERTIGICIRKALDSFERLGVAGEVVVADNGSTDSSREIAETP